VKYGEDELSIPLVCLGVAQTKSGLALREWAITVDSVAARDTVNVVRNVPKGMLNSLAVHRHSLRTPLWCRVHSIDAKP